MAVNFPANDLFRVVEHTDQPEAQLFKRHMPGNCLAQIASADQDTGVMFLDAQDLFNLLTELGDIVAVSLLTKAAETVKVLADLRGGESHFLRELF